VAFNIRSSADQQQNSCSIQINKRECLTEHPEAPSPLSLLVLTRLYAVNAAMAETLAPLVFLEVLR
jgi:hypothetical protein